MNKELRLIDFQNNPQGLLGKIVLYTSGSSTLGNKTQSIDSISKITKAGFKITKHPDKVFGFNGNQKGLTDRSSWSTISECELITPERAKELMAEWKIIKETRVLREELKSKIAELTLEQLQKIKAIIQ